MLRAPLSSSAPRRSLGIAALSATVGVIATIAACSTGNTAVGITPVTGIVVRTESLIAGHGCGRADSQVYKYVAVASYVEGDGGPTNDPIYAATFDCFADGVFANLNASSSGSLSFNVQIYAFDAKAYEANAPAIARIVPPNAVLAADPCATLAPLATWTTTCTATQQANIQVLANCMTLAPPSCRTPFAADAGLDAAPDAIPDAMPGAASDGASDAGADAPPDGAPKDAPSEGG